MNFQIEYLTFLVPLSMMIGGAIWVYIDNKKASANE